MTGESVTCPFCGLTCDDLVLSTNGIDTRGCARAAAGFARADAPRRPHAVKGEPVTFEAAVSKAVRILRGATNPLFYGLTADLHGLRALLALAERAGGAVDHIYSPGLLANAAVVRASGWVTATFAEVANRADFVLLVGCDPGRTFPRFHERLLRNPTPLYREAPPSVAFLGPEFVAPPTEFAPLRAVVSDAELLYGLAALGLLLRGRQPGATHPRLPIDELSIIAQRLQNAHYGVIVWDLSALNPAAWELAAEYLAAILRHLNARSRCVGLPLGGSGNALGAMQAALWQTGWPLRIGFGDGVPRHDPWQYDGSRMLETGEADVLVWASTLAAEPPPASTAPVIALVADDIELPSAAAVEIRIGIPAIDHGGEIVRSDTVITLALQATHTSGRPSLADAARAILAGLEARP